MNEREPKILGVVIHLPIELAIEIFRESGDLQVSEIPAIVKFAERVRSISQREHVILALIEDLILIV
jgi:hypothetical protein